MKNNWSIVGHTWAVSQLQVMLAQQALPHALLITGVEGIGKTTLAHAVVAALFCTSEGDVRPCGRCSACRKLKSGNFPDFMTVEPDEKAGNLKIDAIRSVTSFLSLTPLESQHKVALINCFERATPGAANALLKTLEEPPSYAHLILLATDADLLLPTIVSRSQQLSLRPVSRQAIQQALVERWNVGAKQATQLARLAGGRVGWAVRAATQPEYQQAMDDAIESLFSLLGKDLPERFSYATDLAKKNKDLQAFFEYWLTCWRDVLLMHTGTGDDIIFIHKQDALKQIVAQTTVSVTAGMIQRLEQAQKALLGNANKQLLVENLMIHLPQVSISLASV